MISSTNSPYTELPTAVSVVPGEVNSENLNPVVIRNETASFAVSVASPVRNSNEITTSANQGISQARSAILVSSSVLPATPPVRGGQDPGGIGFPSSKGMLQDSLPYNHGHRYPHLNGYHNFDDTRSHNAIVDKSVIHPDHSNSLTTHSTEAPKKSSEQKMRDGNSSACYSNQSFQFAKTQILDKAMLNHSEKMETIPFVESTMSKVFQSSFGVRGGEGDDFGLQRTLSEHNHLYSEQYTGLQLATKNSEGHVGHLSRVASNLDTSPEHSRSPATKKNERSLAKRLPTTATILPAKKTQNCNCRNSRCLKLYCSCFNAGIYCDNCACVDCMNNGEHERDRGHAIEAALSKNPIAFRPKIDAGSSDSRVDGGQGDRGPKHKKGCNCKKTGCIKKYCECYQAGILCSENCHCTDCKNVDERSKLSQVFSPEQGNSQKSPSSPTLKRQRVDGGQPSNSRSQGQAAMISNGGLGSRSHEMTNPVTSLHSDQHYQHFTGGFQLNNAHIQIGSFLASQGSRIGFGARLAPNKPSGVPISDSNPQNRQLRMASQAAENPQMCIVSQMRATSPSHLSSSQSLMAYSTTPGNAIQPRFSFIPNNFHPHSFSIQNLHPQLLGPSSQMRMVASPKPQMPVIPLSAAQSNQMHYSQLRSQHFQAPLSSHDPQQEFYHVQSSQMHHQPSMQSPQTQDALHQDSQFQSSRMQGSFAQKFQMQNAQLQNLPRLQPQMQAVSPAAPQNPQLEILSANPGMPVVSKKSAEGEVTPLAPSRTKVQGTNFPSPLFSEFQMGAFLASPDSRIRFGSVLAPKPPELSDAQPQATVPPVPPLSPPVRLGLHSNISTEDVREFCQTIVQKVSEMAKLRKDALLEQQREQAPNVILRKEVQAEAENEVQVETKNDILVTIAAQNEVKTADRALSPNTLSLICDEEDSLFGNNKNPTKEELSAALYADQELLVLTELNNCIRRIFLDGRATPFPAGQSSQSSEKLGSETQKARPALPPRQTSSPQAKAAPDLHPTAKNIKEAERTRNDEDGMS